jgi:glycosyltransferase involved in cell wall biosynthesis
MHIGLLIYGSLDTLTGGYLYDRLLCRELVVLGDKATVYSLPWRGYGRHLSDNFSRDLYRTLRQAPLDVLIQDELNHPSLVGLNYLLRRRVDYPLVSLIHLLRYTEPRPAWQNWGYRQVERLYLASVDGFIYNSRDSQQLVEKLVGPKLGVVGFPGKDHLPTAVSPHHIIRRAHQSGPLRLIYVGNVVRRKGLDLLLDALTPLPRRQWRLTVIGSLAMEPDYAVRLQQQVAQRGQNSNVRWLGHLPNETIAAHLQAAQLFAMPSRYEGFGIVYMEALGAGLPVLATNAGAAGEMVRSGVNGYLVEPEDTATLRQHVQTLHHDRDRLARMGLAAYRRYQKHPTWRETAVAIRTFLTDLHQQFTRGGARRSAPTNERK